MAARTILHGQCLLNGEHPPGSPYAAECPVPQARATVRFTAEGWETRRIKNDPQKGSTATTRAVWSHG
jgi:hypothetical protein